MIDIGGIGGIKFWVSSAGGSTDCALRYVGMSVAGRLRGRPGKSMHCTVWHRSVRCSGGGWYLVEWGGARKSGSLTAPDA